MHLKEMGIEDKPIRRLPRNARRAFEVIYLPVRHIGMAKLKEDAVVVITWGSNLRSNELKRNKSYVWIGTTFDLVLRRFRDNFEQII